MNQHPTTAIATDLTTDLTDAGRSAGRLAARTRGAVKVLALVVAVLAGIGLFADTASAATVSSGFGHTSANWNNYTKTASGTVYDDAADGSCVRVYGVGKNSVLGWGSAQYRGQACGKGDHTSWSESPSAYSDGYMVQICKGMPTSSRSNCTGWTRIF